MDGGGAGSRGRPALTFAEVLRQLRADFDRTFPWDWPEGMTVREVVAAWLDDRVADAEAEEVGP